MRYKNKSIRFWAVVILFMSLGMPAGAQPRLANRIEKIIQKSRASDAEWSVMVRDSSGKILEDYQGDKLMRPASNMKLLTSAAVLDELGADFTYKTYMYGLGSRQGDTWNGNIILRGAGDPSMSGRFYNDDRMHVLEEFYAALDSLGIRKINGDLVGNDSYFDEKPYPDGWSWDDLSYYYAVQINALSFNNNTVDLTVRADGKIGATPPIEWFPFDTDYVNFVNEQTIIPKGSSYDEHYQRVLGTNTILLRSNLPQGYVEKESLSILKPPLYFLDTFRKYLEDGGIKVNGDIVVNSEDHAWPRSSYKVLYVHQSPPLKDLLQQLNKKSDNFYAEMLLKTAAAEHYNAQGTTDLGITLVKNFAQRQGLNPDKISMSDGSGMSSTTLISTGTLSGLLAKMLHHKDAQVYKSSLSVAGVDGSLEYRFKGTPLEKRVMGKTGYVSGVRALSGYVESKTNKTCIFSIITNHFTNRTSYIDSIQQEILQQIYAQY